MLVQLWYVLSASGPQIFGNVFCVCLFGLSHPTQINNGCTIRKRDGVN